MRPDTLFQRITDCTHRADPYPLYAELRENGVTRQEDGGYLVGTYHEIAALLHDPRISADPPDRTHPDPAVLRRGKLPPAVIGLDDPGHDRLRRIATRLFGPPHAPDRIDGLHDEITRIAEELIGSFRGADRIDIVDEFACPIPVTLIGRLLGVPHEDMPRIRAWTDAIITGLDNTPGPDEEKRRQAAVAGRDAMALYLGELAGSRRGHPSRDLLSALVDDPGPEGPLTEQELTATATLLLTAGHETTVSLITNGVLTLLRHPEARKRLRAEPELMPGAVEELLRYEPPVHMLPRRTPLADIEVAGVTVPKGAPLILVLASGNRDPRRFDEPDCFDPAREDNQHFGFGGGVHHCFGAPLARLETQIALGALLPYLDDFRPLEDPPPYRRSPVVRGPRRLLVSRTGQV